MQGVWRESVQTVGKYALGKNKKNILYKFVCSL